MQVTNHNRVWMPVALFLLTFLIYAVSLPNRFVWDDEEAIVQNQLIHSLANLPKFWTGGIFNSYGGQLTGGFYRPLTTTVMATLWAISPHPWIFRLFQVSLHATAAVLLFFLLHRILFEVSLISMRVTRAKPKERGAPPGSPVVAGRPQAGDLSAGGAFIGSAIFAVHPGISEAVLWISTLADPLAAVFLLTSFLLVLKHVKVAALFLLLALFTKEGVLVFLPLFFLLPNNKESRRSLALWLGLVTGLYGLLRFSAVGLGTASLAFPAPIAQANVAKRLLTAPAELLYYLRTFLWPFPLSISRHFVITSPADVRFWGSLLIPVTATLLIIRYRNRKIVFFTLWFFLGLLPYFQLIPLSATVADRWLYLPGIGLVGLIFIFLERLPKRVVTVICGTVVLVFSILTIQRSLQWKNGLALFTHDVSVNPRSFDLQNNYGVELFRTGAVDQAKGAFERSITLNPRWWVSLNNLGAVVEREGNVPGAKALYEQSIQAGDYYLAYENLAKLLLFRQKAPQEARDLSAKALKAFPASANLWMVAAIASYQLGNRDEALAAARQLYALAPSDQTAALLSRITNQLPLY